MKRQALAAALLTQLLASASWAQTLAPVSSSAMPQPTLETQAGDAVQSDTAAPDPQSGLQDVVVTARRRIESAQNVPVAVTALSREELERRNLTSLEAVAATIPQLNIARSFGGSGAQITLRGIGSASSSIGIEQSVAVVVDSVYYGQGRVINEGFFDLAGLEVLKGPQSLFFGKNATAGVISINTANPGDHAEALLRAGYEFNAKQIYAEGVISEPVTDTLGLRVAIRGAKQYGSLFTNAAVDRTVTTTDFATGARTPYLSPAGYRDQPREKDLFGRVTLLWRPTDRVTATLKANGAINDTNNSAYNTINYACPTGFSGLDRVTPCRREFTIHQNFMPVAFARQTQFARSDGSSYDRYRSWAVTGNLEYRLDPLTWTTVLNYNWNRNEDSADLDAQSFAAAGLWATERTSYHSFSAESRVQTTLEGPLNGLLGVYYQGTRRDYNQRALFATLENSAAPAGFRYVAFAKDSNTTGDTYSVYGQLSLKLADRLDLTAGGRYIHETKDSFFIHPYADPRLSAGFPGFGPRYRVRQPITSNQKFNDFSPEATLTWRPTDEVTLYGAYKSAYKSGGFSNSGAYTSPGVPEFLSFNPETVRGGEVGLKSTLLDRQLRFNVTAYHYRYRDFQVDFGNALTFALITTNAGRVKQDGVEAEFQLAPRVLPGFQLRGSANYNRSRFGDFVLPCYVGQRPADGCTLTAPNIPFAQDGTNRTLNNAPRWVGSLGTTYTSALNANWDAEVGIDGRYSASYLPSTLLNPLSRQGSYVSLDATLRLTQRTSGLQFAVIGRNLTNRFIVNVAGDATFTGAGTATPNGVRSDQRGLIGQPRTVQLQATVRF